MRVLEPKSTVLSHATEKMTFFRAEKMAFFRTPNRTSWTTQKAQCKNITRKRKYDEKYIRANSPKKWFFLEFCFAPALARPKKRNYFTQSRFPKYRCFFDVLRDGWDAMIKIYIRRKEKCLREKSQKKSVENNQWMHKKKKQPSGVLGNRKAIMKWSPRTFLHSSTGLHPQGSPLEASFRCKFLVSAGPHGSSMMKSPGHRWPPAGYSSWLLGQLQLLQEKGASTPAASLQMSKCLSPKNIHHKKSSKIRNSIGTTLRCWNRSWNNFRHIWPRLFHLKLHRLQPFILLGFLNPTSHLWCGLLGVKEFGNRNYVCVCVRVDVQSWLMMFDDVQLWLMMFDDAFWYFIVFDDVFWYFMMFDVFLWYFMMFHSFCLIFHDTSRYLMMFRSLDASNDFPNFPRVLALQKTIWLTCQAAEEMERKFGFFLPVSQVPGYQTLHFARCISICHI